MLQDMNSCEIYPHIYLTGILTCKGDFYRSWRPSLSVYSSYPRAAHPNTNDSQTAKDVRADQDGLFEIFERLEAFFERLEIYTEAALDQKMAETVTKIMAEVLNIIGITTKEMRQGRTSKSSVKRSFPLTEHHFQRNI
jgi:hypothetical protein